MGPKIFITYSSKDEKVARIICAALESRRLACWISSRNVKPGHNFQEQIVEAIRAAKIMVLVFTTNANNSNEIKKELALASQNNLVVIPVRIEDVTPNAAFAYEFATRQWIDLFDDWENSIARLIDLIETIVDDPSSMGHAGAPFSANAAAPLTRRSWPRTAMISGLAVVAAAAIAYEVATYRQQPTPVSVTASRTVPPTPMQPQAVVALTGQPPPAPQQASPPVQQTSPTPSEAVAPRQQAQLPAAPSQPVTAALAPAVVPATTIPPPAVQRPDAAQLKIDNAARAWAVTKDTTSVAVLQAFVRRYGDTVYGEMASARLKELQVASQKQQVAVVAPFTTVRPSETPCSNLAGSWTWRSLLLTVTVTLHADGSGSNSNGDSARWTCGGRTVHIAWATGLGEITENLTLSEDGRLLEGKNSLGFPVTGSKN